MSMWTVRSWAARPGRAPSAGEPATGPSPSGAGDEGTLPVPPLAVDRCRSVRVGLEGLLAGLARPDAVRLLDREDEHLPVADRAGAGMSQHALHDRLDVLRGHHALDLELGPQVVGQLRAPVALGDALLAARALDLADAQRGEPEREEVGPDRLERLMADERLDLLHAGTSVWVAVGAMPVRPVTAAMEGSGAV